MKFHRHLHTPSRCSRSVVSLVILVVGLRSFSSLQVLAYPKTENGLVTISTAYPGADPDSIAGFITTPIETAVAQANGIDYMTSTSQSSISTITVVSAPKLRHLQSGRRNQHQGQLGAESAAERRVAADDHGQGRTNHRRHVLRASTARRSPRNQITDYLTRVVQPQLQAVPGVQTAEVLGAQTFSLRAWLDPKKLSAYGLTASDVSSRLAANDYISAVGNTKGQMVQVTLTSTTNLHCARGFPKSRRQAGQRQQHPIERRRPTSASAPTATNRGSPSTARTGVFIGIQIAPSANLLTVIKGVQGRVSRNSRAVAAGPDCPHRLRFDRFRERARSTKWR